MRFKTTDQWDGIYDISMTATAPPLLTKPVLHK